MPLPSFGWKVTQHQKLNSQVTFRFVRNKYGKELLIDCARMSSDNGFSIGRRPFLVDFHEILFITEGKGVFHIENESIPCCEGTVLLLPPNKWRYWQEIEEPIDGLYLIFEEDFISKFFNDPFFLYRFHFFYNSSSPSYIQLTDDKLPLFLKSLQDIKNELDDLNPDSEHLLRSILYFILINANRIYSQQFTIKGNFFENNLTIRFRKLLEKAIRAHSDVAYYANTLGVSKSHLNKTLQANLGRSTSLLIRERLAEEAKRELLYNKRSIAEIAYQLNFSEPSNFNRFFKKLTGTTPKEFRHSNSN